MSLELQKYTISYSGKAGKDLGSMKVIDGEEGGRYMLMKLGLIDFNEGGLEAVTEQASRPVQPAEPRRECSRLR